MGPTGFRLFLQSIPLSDLIGERSLEIKKGIRLEGTKIKSFTGSSGICNIGIVSCAGGSGIDRKSEGGSTVVDW